MRIQVIVVNIDFLWRCGGYDADSFFNALSYVIVDNDKYKYKSNFIFLIGAEISD